MRASPPSDVSSGKPRKKYDGRKSMQEARCYKIERITNANILPIRGCIGWITSDINPGSSGSGSSSFCGLLGHYSGGVWRVGTLTEEIPLDRVLGVGQRWVVHSEFPVEVITHLHLHLVDFTECKHSLRHKCSRNCSSMYHRKLLWVLSDINSRAPGTPGGRKTCFESL